MVPDLNAKGRQPCSLFHLQKNARKLDQTALDQNSLEKNTIGLGKDRDNKTLLLYIWINWKLILMYEP